jgi:hypothetical protein
MIGTPFPHSLACTKEDVQETESTAWYLQIRVLLLCAQPEESPRTAVLRNCATSAAWCPMVPSLASCLIAYCIHTWSGGQRAGDVQGRQEEIEQSLVERLVCGHEDGAVEGGLQKYRRESDRNKGLAVVSVWCLLRLTQVQWFEGPSYYAC